MTRALERLPGWAHALILVALCAAIGLPLLATNGFVDTEGHRAAPAWEMLNTGHVAWRGDLHMFGTPFLTKPPATPLTIAASAAILGTTELAARLPSLLFHTLTVLLTWRLGTRLFGRLPGLSAGLAHALTPWLWAPARAAEIEALFVLATQAACFGILTLALSDHRQRFNPGLALWITGATFLSFYAKGPAGLPCILGLLIAIPIVRRSIRPLLRPELLPSLLAAGALFAIVYWPAWSARQEAAAMTEAVDKFLWSDLDAGAIARFPVAAFISAMPAALALLFPWGPNAARERADADTPDARRANDAARLLAIAWVAAIAGFAAFGVTNSRYAMPAVGFATLLSAYVIRGVITQTPDQFRPARRTIARLCTLGHPAVLVTILLIGAGVFIHVEESRRARHTGRDAGRAIAAMLEPDSTIWMVDAITARPELGIELERAGHTVRWARAELADATPPPRGTVVVLRTDNNSDEATRANEWAQTGAAIALGETSVRDYTFAVLRIGPSEPESR